MSYDYKTGKITVEPINICNVCKNDCDWRNNVTGQSCRWLDTKMGKRIIAEYNLPPIVYVNCRFCNRLHDEKISCVCEIKTEKKKK